MKRRRVGTISMAIVLIALGIIIFVAQVNQVSAVKLSIKFWPAALLILGGEILWYSYKYKEDDVIIRYDIFSIFIVLLIVVMNLGIYGLIETNLISKVNSMIATETFTFNIPYKESEVDNEIKKIVIDGPENCNLTIRPDETNKVGFSGNVNITSDSEEKADELSKNEFISINSSDSTLYISFKDTSMYSKDIHHINPYNFNLTLPGNKEIEVNGGYKLELIGDNIKDDWIIDKIDDVKIRLGKNADVKINTLVNNKEMLKGTAKWNIIEENNKTEDENVKGELIRGKGSNSIHILNCSEVIVDELE